MILGWFLMIIVLSPSFTWPGLCVVSTMKTIGGFLWHSLFGFWGCPPLLGTKKAMAAMVQEMVPVQCPSQIPWIPSGKRLRNYGKIHHFLAGKIHYKWPLSINPPAPPRSICRSHADSRCRLRHPRFGLQTAGVWTGFPWVFCSETGVKTAETSETPQWISMKIADFLWTLGNFYENWWISMKFGEFPWTLGNFMQFLWKLVNFYETWSISMNIGERQSQIWSNSYFFSSPGVEVCWSTWPCHEDPHRWGETREFTLSKPKKYEQWPFQVPKSEVPMMPM